MYLGKSENQSIGTSLLFLRDGLEVLVDDGDGKHDTSATADRSHEVRKNAKCTDANATEGRSCGDVP